MFKEAKWIWYQNEGTMTKDLVGLVEPGVTATAVNTADFIKAIRTRLEAKL